jgi:outer membrane protein TolC
MPDGTIDAALGARWDAPSAAWDGASPLTADAAVRCALANNRALRRTMLELDRRRAQTQDAQLPPNPTLDLAIGAPLSMGAVPIVAMLAQQVDWLWRRDGIAGDADAQLRALVFEAAATVTATVVEARADYVEVASALEQRELAQADAAVASRVLAAEESAFAAGEAAGTAVNQARMNAAEADNRVMEATTALVRTQTQLLETMGRGDASLAWTTDDRTADAARAACGVGPAPQPDDDAALHALVRTMRMDLRAAEARVDGARARVALAEANRLPTLILGGGWERDMEGDQAAMVEVQSTLPIWNDGRYRLDAARADLEIARLDADRAWQRAVTDARRALAAVAAADHHAATLRDRTLAGFQANKRLLAGAVDAGERRAVDLWRSEHQENHVRIQLARARRDQALAALGFERAMAGGRLPAAGSAMPAPASPAGGMGPGVPDFEFTALETMQ